METRISGATKEVLTGDEQPTVLIDEHIDLAGEKQ